MKQIITKFSLAILGLIAFSSINAQTVNTDRYITLTVLQGQGIELECGADVNNTDIRIVSGTTDSTITIGIDAVGSNLFMVGATTMTIYGNIKVFYCDDNGIAITGLDVSHNSGLTELDCVRNSITSLDVSNLTQLKYLYCSDNSLTFLNLGNISQLKYLTCYNNNFTTAALDYIFCQLPQREISDYAWITPTKYDTSSNYAIVMATNKQNAIDKNWSVKYNGSDDIPETTGAYVCNVGIEDVNNDIISAKVYPNPLTKDLTIEAIENIERLEVLNVLGKKVLNKEVNKNNLTLDLSTMDKGVYIIKLYSSKGERSYKVMKE